MYSFFIAKLQLLPGVFVFVVVVAWGVVYAFVFESESCYVAQTCGYVATYPENL
jgi:hypothetical protein